MRTLLVLAKKLADKLPDKPHAITTPSVVSSFSLHDTSADEVSKLITGLNPRKGNRINDIPTSIIKISNQILSPHLANIFNACMV